MKDTVTNSQQPALQPVCIFKLLERGGSHYMLLLSRCTPCHLSVNKPTTKVVQLDVDARLLPMPISGRGGGPHTPTRGHLPNSCILLPDLTISNMPRCFHAQTMCSDYLNFPSSSSLEGWNKTYTNKPQPRRRTPNPVSRTLVQCSSQS